MAADLTETIYWGFQHENLLNLFTQVENVDFNGRSAVKEVRGLRAFWVARGGHIEASDMHEEVFEIQRDTLGFHVFEMEDKLRTAFGETQANLVNLGIQRMDAEVNLRVLAAFQAAVPQGSPYYISAGGLSLPALNLALRQVRDTTLDGNVTIIGRATMTDQIIDAIMGTGGNTAGFFPETNENLLRNGVLGVYRGARIITLLNYRDDTGTPFFPANELYVVGRDASKFDPRPPAIRSRLGAAPDRAFAAPDSRPCTPRTRRTGTCAARPGPRDRAGRGHGSTRLSSSGGTRGTALGTCPARLPAWPPRRTTPGG